MYIYFINELHLFTGVYFMSKETVGRSDKKYSVIMWKT